MSAKTGCPTYNWIWCVIKRKCILWNAPIPPTLKDLRVINEELFQCCFEKCHLMPSYVMSVYLMSCLDMSYGVMSDLFSANKSAQPTMEPAYHNFLSKVIQQCVFRQQKKIQNKTKPKIKPKNKTISYSSYSGYSGAPNQPKR